MFQIADEDDIKQGKITDVYFARTVEILRAKGIKKRAKAEIILKGFPSGWGWAVLAGIEEAARLLEGLPINVWAMREGTVFGTYQPVMVIEGIYLDYAVYETAILGLLCQASGIATQAARCKIAAGERQVISFGARRMHPVLAPMIERNAYIGGCDGVAVIKSAELIKTDPVGTIPHSLILMLGDTVAAVKAFDEVIEPAVRRVALIDTLADEKFEALRVAEALGERLFAVRLDTPASRRGDMLRILKEVRWELDFRGYNHVKLFVSGGLDEYEILRLNPAADAYGVGTSISNAPVINFALDIMEIEGKAFAKRGKPSGAKEVWRCRHCYQTEVVPAYQKITPCQCGGQRYPLLEPLIKEGKLVASLPEPKEIRSFVLEQVKVMGLGIEATAGKAGHKGE
jgi:nicotinate phosphoribosyltransferase